MCAFDLKDGVYGAISILNVRLLSLYAKWNLNEKFQYVNLVNRTSQEACGREGWKGNSKA